MQQPLHNMPVPARGDADSLFVLKGEQIVIAQIDIIPEDSVDSVWVKVARDQMLMGWVHGRELLSSVVPDDPVSKFIHAFSLRHLPYFACLMALALA
ncbi:MAG TPA: beta-carotene 15,15'-monooxygenase, partial [Prevotellaceae bacterium]|nr:beta-carotene 15,15'-monooxygenase [Prevotellaceae bacterium]